MASFSSDSNGGQGQGQGNGGAIRKSADKAARRLFDAGSSTEDEDDASGKEPYKAATAASRAILRNRAYQLSPKPSPSTSGAAACKQVDQGQVALVDDSKITLVVDDARFVVSPSLFTAHPDTMLGRMFSSGFDFHPNSRGEFEVADGLSSAAFGCVLEFYQSGMMNCPPHVGVSELREACDYLMVPFTADTVKCVNLRGLLHELSNDGAEEQFEAFLEELILPEMVICASRGDRECHIVILVDEDQIDWDEDFPPQMGEEYTQTIVSTPLYRCHWDMFQSCVRCLL